MKILIILFATIFSLSACTKKTDLDTFSFLDESDIFGGNKFAVILDKYVTSVDIPSEQGITVSQLRCGEIFPIQETRILTTSQREFWVKINDGWVLSSSLQLYKTFEKAKTASERLQQSD
ncbi:MAG: hypothetical protein IJU92_01750 [Spirochaetaceae bacterium]|nr:hypothetical protein [Spirochaetaceae bacterium]